MIKLRFHRKYYKSKLKEKKDLRKQRCFYLLDWVFEYVIVYLSGVLFCKEQVTPVAFPNSCLMHNEFGCEELDKNKVKSVACLIYNHFLSQSKVLK